MNTHPRATQLFRDFSADEEAFYQRIIEECCICIVDIASQLPSFTEHTFAEVLKREDQLLARTNQILQEILHIREQLNFMVRAERFEIDYRLSVARKLDEIHLVGADVSFASRRHRLSVAYITLWVEEIPNRDAALTQKETSTVSKLGKALTQENIGSSFVSVDQALARSRRLLIRGSAGSGKTTLLQWIAVKSATKSFEGRLSDWNNTIPFYIQLRQFVQSGLPRPEDFPGLVAPAIAGTMLDRGWVHTILASGRAIMLVDGLDEVSSSKREAVRVWLEELVDQYPQTRFIVTSRPHAIKEGWMNRKGFSNAELQPMQIADIFMFIEHWHEAVREGLHSDDEKAELQALAEHLKSEVKYKRALRNLTTNPLLCAMLCALNRDRGEKMPTDRVELYEACCYLLLERRDLARRIDLSDYPAIQLNYRQKRRFLEDLAYWMIQNDWSEVPSKFVEERFSKKLSEMQVVTQSISGSDILRLFIERAGIIREPVAGQIDFIHRTFQEFLAARAAADEGDIGVLVKNAHEDQWREVIILASGLTSIPMREMLISNLLKRGDREKKGRSQLHLLAVACLETSLDVGTKVKIEVEKRLGDLVPLKDIADTVSLAAAGELALKYLVYNENDSARNAAACIRTLALIGGDIALELLEEYANDIRPEVIDELLKAWDSFDIGNYAKRILSEMLVLKFSRLSTLEGLQYLTKLNKLVLIDCPQVSDLSPLANLTRLNWLEIENCPQINDLSPLAGLKELSWLKLSTCRQVSDLSPLAKLSQLTRLILNACEHIHDLSPLASLTELTWLDLSGCEQVSDLSPLANLKKLSFLLLTDCPKISDLQSLKWLTRLKIIR